MDDEVPTDEVPTAVERRLERVEALGRSGAAPRELLAELRGLLRDAERVLRDAERARSVEVVREEVVERLRTAPHGT